jgi:hypothetical protein
MANLTIVVDEVVLQRARARALESGTSVNAVLSEYLTHYAGADPAKRALSAFLDVVSGLDAGSGADGRRWTREELHDRPSLR